MCKTSVGSFGVTTFPTEELKNVWLEAAAGRHIWYVLGPRWAVSTGTQQIAETLQRDLGGTLRNGEEDTQPQGPPVPSAR